MEAKYILRYAEEGEFDYRKRELENLIVKDIMTASSKNYLKQKLDILKTVNPDKVKSREIIKKELEFNIGDVDETLEILNRSVSNYMYYDEYLLSEFATKEKKSASYDFTNFQLEMFEKIFLDTGADNIQKFIHTEFFINELEKNYKYYNPKILLEKTENVYHTLDRTVCRGFHQDNKKSMLKKLTRLKLLAKSELCLDPQEVYDLCPSPQKVNDLLKLDKYKIDKKWFNTFSKVLNNLLRFGSEIRKDEGIEKIINYQEKIITDELLRKSESDEELKNLFLYKYSPVLAFLDRDRFLSNLSNYLAPHRVDGKTIYSHIIGHYEYLKNTLNQKKEAEEFMSDVKSKYKLHLLTLAGKYHSDISEKNVIFISHDDKNDLEAKIELFSGLIDLVNMFQKEAKNDNIIRLPKDVIKIHKEIITLKYEKLKDSKEKINLDDLKDIIVDFYYLKNTYYDLSVNETAIWEKEHFMKKARDCLEIVYLSGLEFTGVPECITAKDLEKELIDIHEKLKPGKVKNIEQMKKKYNYFEKITIKDEKKKKLAEERREQRRIKFLESRIYKQIRDKREIMSYKNLNNALNKYFPNAHEMDNVDWLSEINKFTKIYRSIKDIYSICSDCGRAVLSKRPCCPYCSYSSGSANKEKSKEKEIRTKDEFINLMRIAREQMTENMEDKIICHNCGSKIPDDNFCIICATSLKEAKTKETVSNTCPHCKTKVPSEFTECPWCYKPLKSIKTNEQQTATTNTAPAELETIVDNLRDGYKQLVPGTFQHSDQLTKERLTNQDLRNEWLYTADGIIYYMKNNTPMLAITREPYNPILKNIDDAYDQLIKNFNYQITQKDFEDAINSDSTEAFDLTKLRLSGSNDYYRALEISSSSYDRLSSEERRLAERIYGQGNDFINAMQMFASADIEETRILVLSLDYVKKNTKNGLVGRASWLGGFGFGFSFSANDHGVNLRSHLRGVCASAASTGALTTHSPESKDEKLHPAIFFKTFCVKCRKKTDSEDISRIILKNGRKAITGTCKECGTKVFKFLKDGE